ncbi:hypothetical protein [Loktanella sp. M215]|uniref:hypothetical protein n=1 Tax=Loktanella sp. M215 TaxID=2675431 RepID=UPI001F315632|nr:hypothetical protein [Loktanella sp. M215]MCF7702308.1 hypothetical protein [Loktanella sp. M215]
MKDLVDVITAGCDGGVRGDGILEPHMIFVSVWLKTQKVALSAAIGHWLSK